jgi:exosortase A-associated hydrolase 2
MDLLGCGDSAGDYGDATWEAWISDVVYSMQLARLRFAQQWPAARQPPLWLWGLRAGCLLAAEAAARMAEPVDLLFWQPSVSGKVALQQFLRLATGAALIGKAGAATTESLRQSLAEARPVTVAGYRMHPKLASGLEAARLRPVAGGQRLVWLDVSHLADATLTPATQQAMANWEGSARTIAHSTVQGPMFWQTSEIETAPALLDATVRLLSAGTPKSSGQAFAGGTA